MRPKTRPKQSWKLILLGRYDVSNGQLIALLNSADEDTTF